jgi:hypothetical protein
MECPKCRKEIADNAIECPHCRIVVAKYKKRQKEIATAHPSTPVAAVPVDVGSQQKKGNALGIALIIILTLTAFFIYRATSKKQAPTAILPPASSAPTAEKPEVPAEEKHVSEDSFKEGEKKIDKMLKATKHFRIGNPEGVLEKDQPQSGD